MPKLLTSRRRLRVQKRREDWKKMLLMIFSYLVIMMGAMAAVMLSVMMPLNKSEFMAPGSFSLMKAGMVMSLVILLAGIGIYLGNILWLLVWKFFATREQVMEVASMGPLTRFDHWIIRVFGPPPATLTNTTPRTRPNRKP
jgi:uncharacterized membrane protein